MKLILPMLTFVLVSTAPAAWALPDLNKTVESFTAKVKSAGSYGAITAFIDWPSLYGELSPEELKAADVGTPADLKRLVDAFLANPARMLDLEWQKKEAELTPLQREMMRPRFEETKAQAVQRWNEQNKALSRTTFRAEISKVENKDNTPTSEVTLIDGAQSGGAPWKLRFEKKGENWFLAPNGAINIQQILAAYTLNKTEATPSVQ